MRPILTVNSPFFLMNSFVPSKGSTSQNKPLSILTKLFLGLVSVLSSDITGIFGKYFFKPVVILSHINI